MQHLVSEFSAVLLRDLDKLAAEIRLFEQEENLWKTKGHTSNSAGNLCLHLVGNLNTYIGAILGGSGYVRDRDAEFSLRNIPKEKLLEQIEEVKRTVASTLERLSADDLQKPYPQQVLGYEMTVSYFLIHLYGHLNYHLGQINYLRRILE
ncbi:DinB family protein [Pontibacter sp. FD36]|uniref:DinB family protein n=1 Tax=Pontibacter sp. FD36 TaxID=2789860 RepID=UPI0018AB42B4|nr:DinB family protein [Pontibacter sp. FD36]MBF8963755.1 DinB family protein [Pontibacter sp. FD36]